MTRIPFRFLLVLVVGLGVGACAGAESVTSQPLRSGHLGYYDGNAKAATSAALQALSTMDVEATTVENSDGGTVILVSRSLSIFSRRVVGRVFLDALTKPPTPVFVQWEKGTRPEDTATTAKTFAAELFAKMGATFQY